MNNSENRMQEAIYDITLNVVSFMKQDWWRGMPEDSRMVFDQVVKCAKFYEENWPNDDPDYLEHIDMLALAWFEDEAHVTLTDEEQTYLWKDQRIAEQIRKHIPDGWNDYDYDCWCHLEFVADDQVTADEYHELNGKFDDLMELYVEDREKLRKMLYEIRNHEKTGRSRSRRRTMLPSRPTSRRGASRKPSRNSIARTATANLRRNGAMQRTMRKLRTRI